jgi:hypothetical protein
MADVGRDRLSGTYKADVQPQTTQPALVELLWEKSGKGRQGRRGLWYSHLAKKLATAEGKSARAAPGLLGQPKGKKPKGKK